MDQNISLILVYEPASTTGSADATHPHIGPLILAVAQAAIIGAIY
jgi:hypothetical protein